MADASPTTVADAALWRSTQRDPRAETDTAPECTYFWSLVAAVTRPINLRHMVATLHAILQKAQQLVHSQQQCHHAYRATSDRSTRLEEPIVRLCKQSNGELGCHAARNVAATICNSSCSLQQWLCKWRCEATAQRRRALKGSSLSCIRKHTATLRALAGQAPGCATRDQSWKERSAEARGKGGQGTERRHQRHPEPERRPKERKTLEGGSVHPNAASKRREEEPKPRERSPKTLAHGTREVGGAAGGSDSTENLGREKHGTRTASERFGKEHAVTREQRATEKS